MNSSDALLSVVVPAYNAENYLKKCIESLINQTYDNLEIILVNDGSSDATEEICLQYQAKDGRIRYFRQENCGVSRARKNGIVNSRGEYIAFVDADDYMHTEMCETMMGVIIDSECDIAECGYYHIYESGKSTEEIQDEQATIIGTDECLKDLLIFGGRKAVLWNKIYKRSLINVDELKEYNYSEDYLWNTIFHSRCEKKVIISEHLYYHLINHYSACNRGFNAKRLDSIYALIDARDYVRNINSGYSKYVTKKIMEFCVILYPQAVNSADDYSCNEIRRIFNEFYDKKEARDICSTASRVAFDSFRRCPQLCMTLKKCRDAVYR